MGMNIEQLENKIIKPVLTNMINPWDISESCGTPEAIKLVKYTIVHESNAGKYIEQEPDGPAVGIIQMEPSTFYDCWAYLENRKREDGWDILWEQIIFKYKVNFIADHEELFWNNALAVAMCRLQYLRQPESLPRPELDAIADYWYRNYNKDFDTPHDEKTTEFKCSIQNQIGDGL